MSNNNNDLSKRVHWRRIKNIIRAISKIEGVDKTQYDFNNICCYTCEGIELHGKNVTYQTNGGLSCWVKDNTYDVFEISATDNKHPGYGDYLYLAHNTDFNYWTFGEMTYRLKYSKTHDTTSVYATTYYIPFGAYTFGDEVEIESVRKTVAGRNLVCGGKVSRDVLFDPFENRMKAHGNSEKNTMSQVNKTNSKRTAINEKNNVKIHNDNKNRQNKNRNKYK